ncbi:MAG: hypothetical protein KDC90_00320 [Ignavibacteriae bacterium]|nr:hypothetical protein [Ignavibacteriota bacterium]
MLNGLKRIELEVLNFKSLNHIEDWLEENKIVFQDSIQRTECYKWTRWQDDNSMHVFPCVCSSRNKECIFIETYYEVQKAYLLIQKKQQYLYAIEEYHKIKHNKNAIFEWVKYYENLGKEVLYFNPEIKINTQQEPYEIEEVVLSEGQCLNLLKFKEIFSEYYCSEEYGNY